VNKNLLWLLLIVGLALGMFAALQKINLPARDEITKTETEWFDATHNLTGRR